MLAALTDADGALSVGALRAALGADRVSLRGLTGPVTTAVQRLQQRHLLPADLPRPLHTRYALDGQGYRRLEALVMPPDTVASFRTAISSPDLPA